MKRFLFAAVPLLFSTAIARAHANLDHADPKVGSTITDAPSEVKIWFSEGVESSFSSIEVDDASGKRVDKQDVHVDDKDGTLLIVSVPNLVVGQYTVKWKVVAKDTHHTHGDFQFTVAAKS